MLKRKMRFRLSSLLFAVAIAGLVFGWQPMRLSYLCWRMSNRDVTINVVDLQCTGSTATIVSDYGLSARSKLKKLLTDPDRFVAAHAALAEITHVKRGGTMGSGPGTYVANKLHYEIADDGAVLIRMNDNLHLQDWWIDEVAQHTGTQIWDEESEQLVWYDDWQQDAE